MRPSTVVALLFTVSACYGSMLEQPRPTELEPGGEIYNTDLRQTTTRNRELAQQRLMDDRPASPEEIEALGPLMDTAEELRQLVFIRDLQIRVQSKKAMHEYIKGLMQGERVQRSYARAQALGQLPAGTTMEKLIDDASKLDLLGYYEPHEKYLVLRSDVAYGLSTIGDRWDRLEWRSTIVHELVHALQDQHFDLAAAMDAPRTTDENHAFMALAEGDATFTELRFGLARLGIELDALVDDMVQFERILNGLQSTSAQGAMATPIEQQPGIFRYRAGAVFAAGLWRDVGLPGINRAFRKPPRCAEEILDRSLFMKGHRHAPIQLPGKATLQRAGYTLHHEDTLGRIELAAYLQGSGLGGDLIAAGWVNDRIAVFERKGTYAALWAVQARKADEAKAIAARATDAGRDDEGHPTDTIRGFERNGFAVILSNIDAKLHEPLRAEIAKWVDGIYAKSERAAH